MGRRKRSSAQTVALFAGAEEPSVRSSRMALARSARWPFLDPPAGGLRFGGVPRPERPAGGPAGCPPGDLRRVP